MQDEEESKQLVSASSILLSIEKRYEQAKLETIHPLEVQMEEK